MQKLGFLKSETQKQTLISDTFNNGKSEEKKKKANEAITMSYFTGFRNSDNNGVDRPTQLLSTCFCQLRVWLERVCLLRICPLCMK